MLKLISWFFKALALLLVVIFVIFMPLSLLIRNAGAVLFDKDVMYTLVQENLFDTQLLTTLGKEVVIEMVSGEAEYNNPIEEYVFVGLSKLSDEQWDAMMALAVPPRLMSTTLENNLDQFYGWLEDEDPDSSLVIEVAPVKQHVAENSLPLFELVLDAQPPCTVEQLEAWATVGNDPSLVIPQCRPPEPYYSNMLDIGASQLPRVVQSWPDQYNVTDALNQNEELTQLKQTAQQGADLSAAVWVPFALLLVLAVPMGARSFNGAMKWAGWPLVLAGFFMITLALLQFFATEGMISGITQTATAQGVPSAVTDSLRAAGTALFARIARPTFLQGIFMILVGAIFLVLAAWFKRDEEDEAGAATEIAQGVTLASQTGDATPAGMTQAGLSQPSQRPPQSAIERLARQREADELRKREEQGEEGEEDDSKPSGMFG